MFFGVYAQKLETNEVDEFTGLSIQQTSYTRVFYKAFGYGVNFRVSKIDSAYFIDLKIVFAGPQVYAVAKGAKIIFILDDASTYEITSIENKITTVINTYKDTSLDVSYINYNDKKFEVLGSRLIKKVRIYTTEGYIEGEVKPKDAEKFMRSVKLIE
jgi:hypothetical protein